ncbi:MAG TPA: hypothetical protein VFG15_16525 [Amycolatopsis sp.]|nr:hypothetical protein [Amycolatopsis sp.]
MSEQHLNDTVAITAGGAKIVVHDHDDTSAADAEKTVEAVALRISPARLPQYMKAPFLAPRYRKGAFMYFTTRHHARNAAGHAVGT